MWRNGQWIPDSPAEHGDILSQEQVSALLSIAPRTVRKWAKSGILPAHQAPDRRRYYFYASEIGEWLRRRQGWTGSDVPATG